MACEAADGDPRLSGDQINDATALDVSQSVEQSISFVICHNVITTLHYELVKWFNPVRAVILYALSAFGAPAIRRN